MFACHLCLRRYLNSILSVHPRALLLPSRRTYASVAVSRITSSSPQALKALAFRRIPEKDGKDAKILEQEEVKKKRGWARGRIGGRVGGERENTVPVYLTNIKDPLRLASLVQRKLEQGDTRNALDLIRKARGINTVVSWNHLIDWRMGRGDVSGGLRSFNEMKKRGVQPDSYTFTIILKNLANYSSFGLSGNRALSVYNSMLTPNSSVKPSIIHTNAVLNVCARIRDLDSLWSIVSSLPIVGPNAPDTVTYTILLHGIQRSGEVEDGHRAWAGILSRWSQGRLWIDEALACAMCKVLVTSEREDDWREVFVVIEQVFGIKRLDVPETQGPPSDSGDMIFGEEMGKLSPLPAGDKRFEKQRQAIPDSNKPAPGPMTLQCLLEACTKLNEQPLAMKYWNTLSSDPYNIHPDLENHNQFLRLLRRTRSGPEALDFIRKMESAPYRHRVVPTAKTFYIALSACKRSGRTGSFPAAEKMLDLMQKKYSLRMDAKICDIFLQSAAKTEDTAIIKKALRIVDEAWDSEQELKQLKKQNKKVFENSLILVKRMWSVIDILLDGNTGWGHGERDALIERKRRLGKWVTGCMKRGFEVRGLTLGGKSEGEED